MNEIKIGNQIWMNQNLNVNTFRNGDLIIEAKSESEWIEANKKKKPVWCYYEFDATNEKYGKLYNWYAVNDPRQLSPEGWSLATDSDWTELDNFISSNSGTNGESAIKLKSTAGWIEDGNGTDDFGYKALPGGFCTEKGQFAYINEGGYWWSASEYNNTDSWRSAIVSSVASLNRGAMKKKCGLSVRCIKI